MPHGNRGNPSGSATVVNPCPQGQIQRGSGEDFVYLHPKYSDEGIEGGNGGGRGGRERMEGGEEGGNGGREWRERRGNF